MTDATILLTGANGFVGRHVARDLAARGYRLRLAQRSPALPVEGALHVPIGDLAEPVDWTAALSGVDHVVHMAGLAHADGPLPESLYDAVNHRATLALAQAAQRAGVKRFVFVSSIRAQSGPSAEGVLDETAEPRPTDAYGRSKLAAERGLAELDLDCIVLRPVLVYGAGVKANMAALLKLARLPVPLPLGALSGRRSVLAVENLADAVAFALSEACPPRRVFNLSDGEAITVPAIIAALRAGLGRGPGLLAVPAGVLRGLARLAGRPSAYERLDGSLEAPPRGLFRAGWRPPLATAEALALLARTPSDG